MPKHRRYSAPAGEPQLARAARRALGAYYTPPEIVKLIVDLTLQPAIDYAEQGFPVSERIAHDPDQEIP